MGTVHYQNDPFDAHTSNGAGPSNYQAFMGSNAEPDHAPPPLTGDPTFDILEWHPAYQSCQRFFLDHAQHEAATQALSALINIRLPLQYLSNPISSSTCSNNASTPQQSTATYQFNFPRPGGPTLPNPPGHSQNGSSQSPPTFISLVPYLRRLVVTGFDKAAILHGFFGDDYRRGVLPLLDCERRNYLFSAKHGGWRSCKKQYDSGSGTSGDEGVPFMKPLDGAKVEELMAAEKAWSAWLAMEDWMVGPRAPDDAYGREQTDVGNNGTGGVRQEGFAPNASGAQASASEYLPDGVSEVFRDSEVL